MIINCYIQIIFVYVCMMIYFILKNIKIPKFKFRIPEILLHNIIIDIYNFHVNLHNYKCFKLVGILFFMNNILCIIF